MKYQQPAQTFENLDKPRISFSGFDLSHRHTTTFDMGQVIPIALLEVIPNDRWDLSVSGVLRMQPLVAPILHPVKLKVQAWFIPNRLLMASAQDGATWEDFITGGDNGLGTPALPLFDPHVSIDPTRAAAQGSLWDRFGYNPIFDASAVGLAVPVRPLVFPHRAYAKLWNDWFRIPGIQSEIDIFDNAGIFVDPFYENWPRDYFTSALPFLQRGVSPSLPVLGSLSALSNSSSLSSFGFAGSYGTATTPQPLGFDTAGVNASADLGGSAQAQSNADAFFDNGGSVATTTTTTTTVTANLSTVDTKQIRLAFLYQAFLERMARGGARYAEMLPNIWGARPLDQRLNRVEYIGGYTAPWLISEVLQTAPQTDNAPSGDTTVQGTMAGHGINLPTGNCGSYRVDEHGWIMITACTYPDSAYQQGMPRSVLRRVREEFPSPSFVGLSEQEIFNAELFNQDDIGDPTGSIGRTPFGYTGRYNEMRFQPSIVSSEMRGILDYWHLGRKFTALPVLNNSFVSMSGSDNVDNFKRIFGVQNVPGVLATFGITAHVVRPIPFMAVPAQLGGGLS